MNLTSFKVLISDALEQLTLALSIKHKAEDLLGRSGWGRKDEKEERRRERMEGGEKGREEEEVPVVER